MPPEPAFTRYPWWRRWFGARSEKAAARFLRGLGYRIVAANVADTEGEIDLIAVDGRTLVIVEVRSTASDDLDRTTASVDDRKQRKVTGAALRFLKRRRLLGRVNVRYDIVVLSWPATAREPVVRHIPHAFEPGDRFQFFS